MHLDKIKWKPAQAMPPRLAWMAAILGLWTLCFIPAVGASVTTTTVRAEQPTEREVKAFCGIRCLYAAALSQGLTFPAADLVKPRYVGSREGSSIEELELAARDHGLHTFAFVNGTIDSLRLTSCPVILHVESVPGSGRYDHFVLCLGVRGKNILVLDTAATPGEPAQAIKPRDLQLIWDGTGLIVSKAPMENAIFAAPWRDLVLYGGAFICIVALGKLFFVRRPIPILRRVASLGVGAEVLAIITLALLAPSAFALCADGGLLAHSAQVALIEQTHAAYFLPRVSLVDAEKDLTAGSAVFVDARYAADYGSGHIPGAINVPVTAGAAMASLYMHGVGKDSPVIVYCQSKSCPFSKSVATGLLQQGYTSVRLLDGGWQEWSAWKH